MVLVRFQKAASVHGCHDAKLSPPNFTEAKTKGCDVEYHTVPGDESFPDDAMAALRDVGASVTVYEGLEHGFAIRGDFKGDDKLRENANKVFAKCVELFAS